MQPATDYCCHCEEGEARRTPGWPLLPCGQFTFWQSPGTMCESEGSPRRFPRFARNDKFGRLCGCLAWMVSMVRRCCLTPPYIKNPPFPEKRGIHNAFHTPGGYWQRKILPIEVKFSRRVVEDADPYNTNSIRRAEASDQSRRPNGVIRPPGHQNEMAPGPARYAERKLATSRASPKDVI